MAITLFTLVFRIPAIIIGFLMAYYGYKIYKNTKGAMKGWFYLAVLGISLFLWSFTAMLFKIIDNFTLRAIFGSVFLLAMAYASPMAYSKFVEDLSIKPWIKTRYAVIMVTVTLAIIAAMNLLDGSFSQNPLNKILSISHFTLATTSIFGAIPAYFMMKHTGKLPWVLGFLFCALVGIGLNLGQYYDNCCGQTGKLEESELCAKYDLDYMKVYESSCNESLVKVGAAYQLLLLVAIILQDISFYLSYKHIVGKY